MSTESDQMAETYLRQIVKKVAEERNTTPEALQDLFGRTSFNYKINKARMAGALVAAPMTIQ